MANDVTLYLVNPGDRTHPQAPVGRFSIGEIEDRGQRIDSMKCLSIDIEARGPDRTFPFTDGNNQKLPLTVSWLQLEVVISTLAMPRHKVGRVHIGDAEMLSMEPGSFSRGTWNWEIRPEDVEAVDQARSNQSNTPIYFHVDISGIEKLVGDNGQLYDIVAVRSAGQQLKIELSHWDRLLQALDYAVAPSQTSLVGRGTLEHPSWAEATRRLDNARLSLRHGEDYNALRESLSAVEALVSAPYVARSWEPLLKELPPQKAEGLAELFSGFATFCNKTGHHRERSNRDDAGDLATMPLDHWEAEIAVAMAQYVVTYASRLRMGGILAEHPPAPAAQAQATP